MGDQCVIYQIDERQAILTELLRFKADFSKKESEVNRLAFTIDNKKIFTGGQDGNPRLWLVTLSPEPSFELVHKFDGHHYPISDVSIDHKRNRAASVSPDKTCRIYDLEKGTCLKRLCFSESMFKENLQFKGVRFFDDLLYTLSTNTRGSSYINKWDATSTIFKSIDSGAVHPRASCSMNISADGNSICIGTNDGYVKGVATKSLNVYRSHKIHKMPITSVSFTESQKKILTSSADYSFKLTPNTTKAEKGDKMFFLFLALIILGWVILILKH